MSELAVKLYRQSIASGLGKETKMALIKAGNAIAESEHDWNTMKARLDQCTQNGLVEIEENTIHLRLLDWERLMESVYDV